MDIDLGVLRKVRISDINIGERARKEYGDIGELASNIRDHGLIQPIAVYSLTLEPPYLLLAGGRRMSALTLLGVEEVACRIYSTQKDERELKAIELMENLRRKQLTYSEEIALQNQLHDTLVEMKGEKVARSADAPGHSLSDTARLLGKSVASLSKDRQLAKAIDKFPVLGQLTNKNIAMQVLKRMRNMAENTHTIVTAKDIIANTRTQRMIDAYKVGDFLECARALSADKYALIEVDPPYGIDLPNIRAAESTRGLQHSSYIEIPKDEYIEFCESVMRECYRVARDNAWLLWWCGPQWLNVVQVLLRKHNFEVGHVPAIWKKGSNPGQSQSMDRYLGNNYEMFVYARKGEPRLRNIGRSNVFDYNIVHPTHRIHPIERPLELMCEIFATFTWPGAELLIPFAGSGNSIVSAFELQMTAVGYDLSQEYKDAYDARLIRETKQLELSL
jgi:adenine-specific DNA-methyltransferase